MSRPRQVRKRDGRLVPFHREKIAEAIFRAAQSVGGEDRFLADELAGVVASHLDLPGAGRGRGEYAVPTIEDVQDTVERVLIEAGHARTAKAYILYRNRRAQARLARTRLREDAKVRATLDRAESEGADASPIAPGALTRQPETQPHPVEDGLPGTGGSDPVSPRWSKASIAEALVREDGVTRIEAEDVARVVEARLLSSRVPHITPTLVRALVVGEMFVRGHSSRLCEDTRTGIERTVLDAALRDGLSDRRATNPASFAEGVGETLLARHVLDHVLSPTVAEAHRSGDIHVYDAGAPLRLTAVALDATRLVSRHLEGHAFTRHGAAMRLAAAIDEVILRYAPHVARSLALEGLNVLLAPFFAHLDEDGLRDAIRHVLLSPGLRFLGGRSHVGRGGLLRLEIGLTVDVPVALRHMPTPTPTPPGRCFGDYRDESLRMTRALLHEVAALTREGHRLGASFDLVLPRGGSGDSARRALEAETLRVAAEIGEPLVVLAPADEAIRGTRWLRMVESEASDPIGFDRGDVSAASATAVNLVAAALRTGSGGEKAFLREAERLVALALDVAETRQGLLDRACSAPGGTLYALASGRHPVVDLEGAHHLVEIVGLEQATSIVAHRTGEQARRALRERVLVHVGRRLAHEATARRLLAALVEGVSDEAALRCAELDRERFPRTARWWAEGDVPSYGGHAGLGRRVEGAALERSSRESIRRRVRHLVDPERLPSAAELSASLTAAQADPTVIELALGPWPRRQVRMLRNQGESR